MRLIESTKAVYGFLRFEYFPCLDDHLYSTGDAVIYVILRVMEGLRSSPFVHNPFVPSTNGVVSLIRLLPIDVL